MRGPRHDGMDGIFQEVREAASPRTWSRGVQLARGGAVAEERADGDEVVLWIAPRQGQPSRRVQLYPMELEWACDCGGDDDPCEHVAASVIAARQADRSGTPLPRKEVPAEQRVGYRFTRTPQGLQFDRVTVAPDGAETPLRYALAALAAGRAQGPRVAITNADREVERVLGTNLSGWLPRNVLASLLGALAQVSDLRLDGAPVHASSVRAGLVARVTDRGRGFVVTVDQDPTIEEVFPNGVVRCGDTLKAVGDPDLTAEEIRIYRQGRLFEGDEVAVLVSEVLPDLEARLPVEVRTRRLPGRRKAPPRVVVTTAREGDDLAVLPLLVYGDPPLARVDAGRLVPLPGAKDLPVRDEGAERRLAHGLTQRLGLEVGRKVRFSGLDAVDFAERLARADGAEVEGTAQRAFFRAPPLEPRVDVGEADFEAHFTSPGRGEADPARVVQAWRQGESLVPLLGGGFAPLPAEWLARHGDRLADLLAAKADREALPPAALPDLGRFCEALERPRPPALDRLAALVGEAGLPEAELPEDLSAELRDYQREGVRWLAFLREAGLGALLADDMGLGKTLQTLAAVRGRTLVVAPTSVIHNWADEAARFRPALRTSVYHGPGRALDPEADLTVTTYALLRLDAERLGEVEWDLVVLDEAQAIKNPDSQVARAAYALRAGFRVALTGTPVENRLEELWSQLHFTNPGLLGGRSDFQDRYARPIAAGEPGAAPRLRERIRPFLLRRLKREVARELPPRTDVVLRCSLGEGERAVYDAVRAATREEVVARLEGGGGGVMAALEALLRLRQAACHPALVPGQHAERSAKVDLLLETLDEALAEGHKALVFSQWTSLLDLVEPHLETAGIPFTRLDGGTADRAGVVRTFQAEDGPPVMLVSLKAGGSGLNLTAADHVFLLDPWWNPAVEDQAADRAHRIGQDRPVLVHRLVAEDTVDERILELQAVKRSLADAALGEADAAAGLTRDDLLALLG